MLGTLEDTMTLTPARIDRIEATAYDVLDETFGSTLSITLPVDMIKVVKSQGVDLVVGAFEGDDISGILDRENKKIYVSSSESYQRKSFTVAHELGHYLLHRDKTQEIFYRSDAQDLNPEGKDIEETEANWFAASLLIPSNMVNKYYSVVRTADELAVIFGVSLIV